LYLKLTVFLEIKFQPKNVLKDVVSFIYNIDKMTLIMRVRDYKGKLLFRGLWRERHKKPIGKLYLNIHLIIIL